MLEKTYRKSQNGPKARLLKRYVYCRVKSMLKNLLKIATLALKSLSVQSLKYFVFSEKSCQYSNCSDMYKYAEA